MRLLGGTWYHADAYIESQETQNYPELNMHYEMTLLFFTLSGPLIWVLREIRRLELGFSEVDSVFLKKMSAG